MCKLQTGTSGWVYKHWMGIFYPYNWQINIELDVYIPGCPPRPEAIIDAIIKLRKKISNESMRELGKIKQTHRFYSTTHNMKVGSRILTGEYLRSLSREKPPQGLTEAMGMSIPPALATMRNIAQTEQ